MSETTTMAQTKAAVPSTHHGATHEAFNGQGMGLAERLLWEDRLYEIVNGKQVEKPMGYRESRIAFRLGYNMEHHARTGDIGEVCVEMLFCLDAVHGLERRPDVAFVSYERWPRKRQLPQTNAAPVVPDLAVEVVSPSNLAKEVLEKVGEYFRAGVRLVWLVYPDLNQVHVFESPTKVRILAQTDELDGGNVLPEFRLKVAALFEIESEAKAAEPS